MTFAGLPEGADYQAGLTVFVREGRAKRMPPNAYLVERLKLGLVRGKLAAWTVARFKEEGDNVREEATAGFASLAPEGAEDYTAQARTGSEMQEVARGQEAEEVALPPDSTAVAVQGATGSTITLASATLGLRKGGGGGIIRPVCTDYAVRTYYGVDHLGTVRYTRSLDLSGNVVATSTHDYEPFGVELPGADSCGNTHQFTGHERDQETGNDYMHFRFYAAGMGRFQKPDAQYDNAEENPQGFNMYSYVHGNPVNFNDPTGKYGKGSGWTEKTWKRFDKAQKAAAEDMRKAAKELRKDAGKIKEDAAKAAAAGTEKGKQEAKEKNDKAAEQEAAADKMDAGAAALESDGSDGKVANALSTEDYLKTNGATESGIANTPLMDNGDPGKIMYVNNDKFASVGGSTLRWMVGHESLHTAGLIYDQVGSNGYPAYKFGNDDNKAAFKEISGKSKGYLNPDTLMELVYPRYGGR